MYDLYRGSSTDEQAKVAFYMNLFGQVRNNRVNFEAQWEESAALCWPEYRNSFSFGHTRPPGAKYTQYQVDSSGSIALHRFMAICDALLTPHSMMWSVIRPSDPLLMKDRAVKDYFDTVTKTLWRQRYRAEANFMGQNQQNYQCLGAFGNMGMIIDELDPNPGTYAPGLRYIATSPGELYLLRNHQGRVDGFIRHFRWTARQAHQRWKDKIPPALLAALEKGDQTRYDFLQFVLPRGDYDPTKTLSPQGKPWESCYLSLTGYAILEEGGYRSFPLAHGSYQLAPEEDYGRGPAQMVLPELKTLNAEKADYLKQGKMAADPAYLIGDDGLFDFNTTSGKFNYGGFSIDGRKLVDVVPTGEIQVTLEMMQESQKIINDAFLVSLFPLLTDPKGQAHSAREVIEAANEKGIFLAPTLGRQYSDYVAPMIDRELDVLSYLRLLPPMPPALKEAGGDYHTIFTSPLARQLRGQEISGYMRTVEMCKDVIQAGGDPALLDIFDFETAFPEISEEQFAPPNWMSSPKQMADKRKARAQAQEREAQVKELPGKAAIIKAQAIGAKAQAGQNTGGALSGTPQGGMPMMPGQQSPGGRAFGQPGEQP